MQKRLAATILAALGVCLAGYSYYYYLTKTPRLIGHAIYRSGQLSSDGLARAIRELDIGTVINLKGEGSGQQWYDEEEAVSDELGVELVSLRFETFDPPGRIETRRLVETLVSAKGPVLIHCHSGIDRSGWASVVVRLMAGEPIEKARSGLSRWGGHFCDRDECPLHAFFDQYEAWLELQKRSHTSEVFQRWATDTYAPGKYNALVRSESIFPMTVSSSSPIAIPVTIENLSPEEWVDSAHSDSGVRPGARIIGPFDQRPPDPLKLFRQPHAPTIDVFRDVRQVKIAPGESIQTMIQFEAPAEPGLYFVQIDMVDEMIAWFSDWGRPGLIGKIEVRSESTPDHSARVDAAQSEGENPQVN